MGVLFGLLGEITAEVDGRSVDPGTAKQRCVLASLAVDVGRTVPDGRLAHNVWGVDPPRRARQTLSSYVSRLRRAVAGTDAVDIVRRSGGYALLADRSAVDLHRFDDLRARARALPDEAEVVAELLIAALALWRGEALTGVEGQWAAAERDRLALERFGVECDLVDARLRLAQHAELVTEVLARTAEHPLDERVAGQCMVVLHRCGRTGEALDHYRRLRARLSEELGTEPGAALRQVHQRILGADPVPPTAPAVAAEAVVPRQLPAASASFVGRAEELAVLDKAVSGASGTRGAVVISVVVGTGGIGKTWLALNWAHREAHRFPDGQLFVDLQGFAPDAAPVAPETAVRAFLDAFGVEPALVPGGLAAKTALFRSLVAGRKILLVLDNAFDTAQVLPLLPGSGTCAVLVTSRRPLLGLVTGHGARHVPLAALSDEESRRLLTDRLGDSRTAAEHEAVRTLAELCGGFPLALSIIAGQVDINPRLPVSALVAELRTSGLQALDDDDPAVSLPSVLSSSYRALPAEQAEVFRLLGIAPGADIGLPAAASLAGLAPGKASAVLRGLRHASLLDEDERGRYRMHDLVRLYAAERGREVDDDVRTTALRGLIAFYLHTAFAGERVLAPHRRSISPALPVGGSVPVVITDESAALGWFGVEHPNLLAVQRTAVELGETEAAWQLAWALDTYHFRQGLLHDALTSWQRGVEAARLSGRTADRALAHRCVGQAHARVGDHADAERHLGVALALFRESDDLRGQAETLRVLAWTSGEQGDDRGALEHLVQVQAVFRALGEPIMQADALNATGWFHARLGQYDEARTRCSTALAQFRAAGHKVGEADAAASLGLIAHRTGRYAEAVTRYEAAIALFRELDDQYQVAEPLEGLGETRAALHEPDQACTAWQEAMRLYRAQGRDADAERVRGLLDRIGGTAGGPRR